MYWRKSSFSEEAQSDCVEVSFGLEVVGVRDSKNTEPTLSFAETTWRAALTRLPEGQSSPSAG